MSNSYKSEVLKIIEELERKIGYEFKDKTIIFSALTHSSYLSEHKGQDYEVLEFLGDAVISLIVSEILIKTFPKAREGELSQIRSAVVSENYLAKLSREIELGKYVFMSYGEEQQGGRNRETLLCDVFEAIFGAIYVDSKYSIETPREIFNKLFKDRLIRDIKTGNIPKDYKSTLQVLTQRLFGSVPKYKFVSSKGPEHQKIFTMECVVENEITTSASGKSKKEAENIAAREAYLYLKEKYKKKIEGKEKKNK
jgi:ribonuclease-3